MRFRVENKGSVLARGDTAHDVITFALKTSMENPKLEMSIWNGKLFVGSIKGKKFSPNEHYYKTQDPY